MFDLKKFKLSLSMLVLAIVATGFAGCGNSSDGSSLGGTVSEKTVKGVAIDAAGIAYAAGTAVSVVDANGNTATGKVEGDSGAFSVLLSAAASSGKKGKEGDVKGSILVQVGTGSDALTAIVGDGESEVSVNAVTAAAALSFDLGVDLDAVFSAKKGKVTNTNLLATLAAGLNKSPEEVKSAVASILTSLFGVDADGNPAVSVDSFVSTGLKDSDASGVMLQSLYNFNNDQSPVSFILARSTSTSSSDNGSILNDSGFFASIGRVLATREVNGDPLAFNDFINGVVTSNSVKDKVNSADLIAEMIAVIAALVLDPNSSVTIQSDVASNADAQVNVTVVVTRSGTGDDTITYGAATAEVGDTHTLRAEVLDASQTIYIEVDLKKGTDGLVVSGDVTIFVKDVSVKLSTSSVNPSASTIDLAIALAEVRVALINADLKDIAALIPASTAGRSLKITSTPVIRNNIELKTFINSSTAASGVVLTSSKTKVTGTPVLDGSSDTAQ